MSVLIDPYMFELSNEQEIRDNITFFMNVIKIVSYPEKSKRISIAIYSGMIEKIQKRAIQPFPIQLSMIQDKDLKSTIMQLNNSFSNALIRFVENIDIDECVGNQEFVVRNDEKMPEDDYYFELLSTLLVPCYSETVDLDSKILTGNKENGKQIGDTFELVCNCDTREYQKKCSFVSVNDLVSDKDKVIQELKQKKKKGGIPVSTIVTASIGSHHNHVQANRKKFSELDELSSQNKIVLRLLKELGLFRIIFGRFTPNGVKAIGTMSIQNVDSKDSQDIVTVNFSAETQMVIETFLYFPKGIGELLKRYFKSEQLTYQSVENMIEKIK
jgi:hypothetical protein